MHAGSTMEEFQAQEDASYTEKKKESDSSTFNVENELILSRDHGDTEFPKLESVDRRAAREMHSVTPRREISRAFLFLSVSQARVSSFFLRS